MSDERKKQVLEAAMAAGLDTRSYSVALEIEKLLSSMKDEGSNVDSGTGFRAADLWVTIDGVEYFVTVRPSNKQLLKEGVSRRELGLDDDALSVTLSSKQRALAIHSIENFLNEYGEHWTQEDRSLASDLIRVLNLRTP